MIHYSDLRESKDTLIEHSSCKCYLQSHEHLKAALTLPEITESSVFHFCRDQEDQILYITGLDPQHTAAVPTVQDLDPKEYHSSNQRDVSREILQIQIKDLMCEETFNQMQASLEDNFQNKLLKKVLIMKNESFDESCSDE